MRVVKEFNAQNAAGKKYTVLVIEEDNGPTLLRVAGSAAKLLGTTCMRLDTGEDVQAISDTEFEIVFTGRDENEKITRIEA